jgi:valyl-tRNA synthetase
MICVLTLTAKINDEAPEKYRGMDRFVARKAIVADLEELGLMVEIKKHKLMVPICDRTGQVIEPMLTDQWFIAMSKVSDQDPPASPSPRRPSTPWPRAKCSLCPRTGSTPTTSG